MTEQEMERCLERFTIGKATDVMNFDYAGTLAYLQRLKAENAALRERLDKAVELPLKVGSTVYIIHETDEEDKFNPWIDAGRVVSFSIDVNLWIYVRYNSGLTMWYTKDSFDEEVYITLEEAEARLAELKARGAERRKK